METYYDWTIISHDEPRKDGARQVLARCVCGTEKVRKLSILKNGYSKNCGCVRSKKIAENTTKRNMVHGKSGTRLHQIWKLMRQRCNNVNASGYFNYGRRGIKVCPEWDDYQEFEDWALANGYTESMTLERTDSDGNYQPSNCEWITKSENIARRNVGLTGTGKTLTSRFTKQDAEDMRHMRNEGVTLEVIAGAFGCGISHASRMIKDQIKYYKD